nr:MAG TPA: hypothetical protein [Caudoviricetes sp.]
MGISLVRILIMLMLLGYKKSQLMLMVYSNKTLHSIYIIQLIV